MKHVPPRHRALAEAHRAEAAELVRRAAEPFVMGERINSLIARSAQRLGFTYVRTEDIWRKEARRIDSWEMDLLREWKPAAKPTRSRRKRR